MEREETYVGYSIQENCLAPTLFVGNPFDEQPANPSNGVKVTFSCLSKTIVKKCHCLLNMNGGKNEGNPGRCLHHTSGGF